MTETRLRKGDSIAVNWFMEHSKPLERELPSGFLSLGELSCFITDFSSAMNEKTSRFTCPTTFTFIPKVSEWNRQKAGNRVLLDILRLSTFNFLLREKDELICIGEASLSGIIYHDPDPSEFGFRLTYPLSKVEWLRFGGYEGWYVVENEAKSVNLRDDSSIDEFIAKVEATPNLMLQAFCYEQKTVTFIANGINCVVILSTIDGTSLCTQNHCTDDEEHVFEANSCFYQHSKRNVIKRELAIQTLREVLKKGESNNLALWQI